MPVANNNEIEKRLWSAADELRANSKLKSSEYSVPVLGLIENMSYFMCPHCNERSEIFSHGGAKQEAEQLGIDFLGDIPLDMAIRETSDGGRPIVFSQPNSPHAKAYTAIAEKVWEKVEQSLASKDAQAPNILIQ